MLWGEYWGSRWGAGSGIPLAGFHVTMAKNRYTDCVYKSSPRTLTLTAVFAGNIQKVEDLIRENPTQKLLNTQVAGGVWLDRIGSRTSVPREGRDDAFYRKVLQIYEKAVWKKRRTLPGLLEALGMFNAPEKVVYSPIYPMGYTVRVQDVALDSRTEYDIKRIIRLSRPTCYAVYLFTDFQNPFLWADAGGAAVTTLAWGDADTTYKGGAWSDVERIP